MLPFALACMNSMDASAIVFTQNRWLDLVSWTAGAVFLNRVVLVNVLGSAAQGHPGLSWFRRSFFLLVAAALVLLLAVVSASGPLLGVSSEELAQCSVKPSMVLMLVAVPAGLFALQAVLFQGFGKRWFGESRGASLVSLVCTSVLLVLLVSLARDGLVLPQLCEAFAPSYEY